MTSRPLIIIHGWSDTSDSFKPLAKWLRTKGFDVVEIHLADYISMNDEITLPDLGLAMHNAILDKKIPEARHSFDVLTHSTGALVAREYLRQFCAGDATKTPIRHLCMLAPANFGSPLAKIGKSLIGRLFKGWSWDHIFETGKNVLDALELASPYTFELALNDLFTDGYALFHPDNTMTTVLAGTSPYSDTALDKLKSIAHEDGSDGVVRVSTANLNARHFKLDFEKPPRDRCLNIAPASPPVAFAIFDHNHTSITRPAAQRDSPEWRDLLLNSLTLDTADYPTHLAACDARTDATYKTLRASKPKSESHHLYQHVVFRVHDQFGAPVNDYFIEFYQQAKEDPKDVVFKKIQTQILEKVVTNSVAPNYRSFLLDITDLEKFLKSDRSTKVRMSISAADISSRIRIKNPGKNKFITVFSVDFPRDDFPFGATLGQYGFCFPNQTTLIDITLHRSPDPNVFRLTPYTDDPAPEARA